MDLIDIEDDKIPAEILQSMAVTQEHFEVGKTSTNPSTIRETVV